MTQLFDLTGRVAAITGGAGLLGRQHAEAIAACGGIPVLVDIVNADRVAAEIAERRHVPAFAAQADITRPESVRQLLADILEQDEHDRQSLVRQKEDVGGQIAQAAAGAQIHRAYGAYGGKTRRMGTMGVG